LRKNFSGLKVVGFRADETACGLLRIQYPLDYLAKLGATTQVVTKVNFAELQWADYIIAQRQYNENVVDSLKHLKDTGITIIYEVDDALNAVHIDSPAYRVYHQGTKELKKAHEMIAESHGLTVSTPELAAEYLHLNRNTFVVPNAIDFDIRDWTTRVTNRDPDLTVGWSGGTTHQRDMPILGEIVKGILTKYKHIKFGICTNKMLAEQAIESWNVPSEIVDRIILIKDAPIDVYPQVLSHFDIGVAPIANTTFNRAKSPLKLMEMGSWGIPYVASKVAPYQRYIDQGVDGYTANTTPEWIEKLSILIEDETKRREMGEAAQTKVREHHDYAKNIGKWADTWEAIRYNASIGDVGPGPVVNTEIGRNSPCPCGSGKKYKQCCYPAWS